MIIAIFATFVVLAFQAIFWLRYGYWTPVSGKDFFGFFGISQPDLEWRGFEKILEFFFDIHIGFTFFTIALVLGFVIDALEAESDDLDRDGKRNENPISEETTDKDGKGKNPRNIKEHEKIEPKLVDKDQNERRRRGGR
jgi:hypothetical protein